MIRARELVVVGGRRGRRCRSTVWLGRSDSWWLRVIVRRGLVFRANKPIPVAVLVVVVLFIAFRLWMVCVVCVVTAGRGGNCGCSGGGDGKDWILT